jgi:hypothetical protein
VATIASLGCALEIGPGRVHEDWHVAVAGLVGIAYYLFPNLSPFDLKLQMVYSLPIDYSAAALTFCYGIGYITVMLALACGIFARRDFI